MTEKNKRISCRDIDSLLNLDGVDVKPDKVAIAQHLASCTDCQEKAPELTWFYGQFDDIVEEDSGAPRRPFRWTVAACTAILMVALTALFMLDVGPRGTQEVEGDVAGDQPIALPSRVLPEHFSTVEFGTTHVSPNHAVSTTTAGAFGSLGSHKEFPAGEMEWIR